MATCRALSMCCTICFVALFMGFGMPTMVGAQSGQPQSPDNCTAYNASAPCTYPVLDMKMYCLQNGTTIIGFCDTQEAICSKKAVLAKDLTVCSPTTRSSASTTSRNRSSSSVTTEETVVHTDGHDAAPSFQSSFFTLMVTAVAFATSVFEVL